MKALKSLSGVFVTAGFIFLFFTAGASDASMFTIDKIIIRCIFAAGMIALGFLGFLAVQIIDAKRSN